MATVHQRVEKKRACGFRKGGGIYLVSSGAARPCCKLPYPLTVCQCCGAGIKQARGFTWINTDLFSFSGCSAADRPDSGFIKNPCIMNRLNTRIGLMWVGDRYYSPELFAAESAAQGISKRIAQIPRDFKLGQTWIALAHPKVLFYPDFRPGIFQVFQPTAIEYIVKGNESETELDALEKRGLTLIKVIPEGLHQDYEKNKLL